MIKKYFLLPVFFFLVLGFTKAQNLVPNPSFEDTISCYPRIDSALFWHNPTGYSPDYFNSNMHSFAPYINYDVPVNIYGLQVARTGEAYAGIITAFFGGDNREYIQSQLLDSLKFGRKYLVSFYVCMSDSSPFAVNDIGAYFSSSSVSSPNLNNLPYFPQISNNPIIHPLNQFNTWISIIDSFTAIGGEKYITIGNFKDDIHTDTSSNGNQSNIQYGYYYIDDVSVILIDSSTQVNSPTDPNIIINFNTTNGFLKIFSNEVPIEDLKIYNMNGNLIFNEEVNDFSFYKTIPDLKQGIYILKVSSQKEIITNKIIFTH